MAVREKEISILDRTRTCLNTAEALLRENPSLAGFRDWLDVAAVVTPKALESIDQAKGRLPMNSEVFGLAGTIASGMGELVRAEKDFRESLRHNAQNSEALFGLGTICAKKERWPESGQWFEKALAAFEAGERVFRDKVHEIERSSLSQERKERLLRRKNAQIQTVLFSRASACYGAALSWLNAGDGTKARGLALKAAEHPSYKAKSGEILKKSAVGSRSMSAGTLGHVSGRNCGR